MKGNELERWIPSLRTCNFITVQSNRWMLFVNKHCAIFTTFIKRTPSIKWTLGKVLIGVRLTEVSLYSGCLHVGSKNTDLNFIVVAVTNQEIQWSKNQVIIVGCGEIVIIIILDIWLDVTEDNSYVSVFYILQDVLDVRLLNQLTETESDHRAFVPIIQYKKGAI